MRSVTQRLSLALIWALGGTGALAEEFRPISSVIDPTLDHEASMVVVETLGAALAEAEYVKLDLQVVLTGTDGDIPRVSVERGSSEAEPLDCDSEFGRLDVTDAVLAVFLADIYTHLILSLRFGAEDGGVGYTVACTTREGQPVLSVTGRFYVSHVAVPTANDIQLVAVRP